MIEYKLYKNVTKNTYFECAISLEEGDIIKMDDKKYGIGYYFIIGKVLSKESDGISENKKYEWEEEIPVYTLQEIEEGFLIKSPVFKTPDRTIELA